MIKVVEDVKDRKCHASTVPGESFLEVDKQLSDVLLGVRSEYDRCVLTIRYRVRFEGVFSGGEDSPSECDLLLELFIGVSTPASTICSHG